MKQGKKDVPALSTCVVADKTQESKCPFREIEHYIKTIAAKLIEEGDECADLIRRVRERRFAT